MANRWQFCQLDGRLRAPVGHQLLCVEKVGTVSWNAMLAAAVRIRYWPSKLHLIFLNTMGAPFIHLFEVQSLSQPNKMSPESNNNR